jgi:hypothetical protein
VNNNKTIKGHMAGNLGDQPTRLTDERQAFEDHIRKINPKLLFVQRWQDGAEKGEYKHQEVEEMWKGWEARALLDASIKADADLYRKLRTLDWIDDAIMAAHGIVEGKPETLDSAIRAAL